MGAFELMLHVEQPDAHGGPEADDRKMDEQEGADPDHPHQQTRGGGNRQIGRHGADPGRPARADRASGKRLCKRKT